MTDDFDIPGLITESELDVIQLSDDDRKYFNLLRSLLSDCLGSKTAARAWLVSPNVEYTTCPLDAIKSGMAKRIYQIEYDQHKCPWEEGVIMRELKFGDVVKVKPIDIDEFTEGEYPIVKSYSSRYDKGSVADKDGYLWIDVPEFGYCPIELSQIYRE